MKIFHCDHCQQLVFFENVHCLNCDHALAYLPDLADMGTLESIGENLWKCLVPGAGETQYRLCENYSQQNVCNWAVPEDNAHPLCQSCRLTQVIPNLDKPGNKEAWYKLEIAKRRLVYSLLRLKLPVVNRVEDPEHGLAFEFLEDREPAPISEAPPAPVLTGHHNGIITINIAEADDAEREKRKNLMHESYRTLLGHFRHEVGHYYWDRLIRDTAWISPFREIFGDDEQDYSQALQTHYEQGAPADWQQRFVSAYASSHAWEDWAETWAHYLHMVDTLETSAACGLSLKPKRKDEPELKAKTAEAATKRGEFDQIIDSWFPLTYVLNNLNRGLGLADGYPFVLSSPAIEKLRFVHEVIFGQR